MFNLMWGGGSLTSNQQWPYFSSPGLKLADPGGGSGDLHGLLSTSHHHLNHTHCTQVSKASDEIQFAFDKALRGKQMCTWS